MSELTLDALGFRHDEATVARRIHDLIQPAPQRVAALRQILCCTRELHPAPEATRMLQQQQQHPVGTFPRCRECGHEPRHIIGRGSAAHETFDILHPTGTRHQLECRCTARTPWMSSLPDALIEWKRHHAAPAPTSLKRAPVYPLFGPHRDAI